MAFCGRCHGNCYKDGDCWDQRSVQLLAPPLQAEHKTRVPDAGVRANQIKQQHTGHCWLSSPRYGSCPLPEGSGGQWQGARAGGRRELGLAASGRCWGGAELFFHPFTQYLCSIPPGARQRASCKCITVSKRGAVLSSCSWRLMGKRTATMMQISRSIPPFIQVVKGTSRVTG